MKLLARHFAISILHFAFCISAFAAEAFTFEVAKAETPTPALPRGARRSPAHKVLTAPAHQVIAAPPAQFALVPAQLSMWGNDQYGDCVSAEEAFCKACYMPEIFVDSTVVVDWARQHGYLHGADLASVMDTMQHAGFQVGGQQYDDGAYASVNYSDETVLQSAIANSGPVKIAIDASALPSGAGQQNGWFAVGGGSHPNTDHCVSICAYGSAQYLYSQINTPLPAALPGTTSGYLVFTWSTIGFVDHAWLMGTCTEAWVRNPATVGNPPLTPNPSPAPPTPAPSPTPRPRPHFFSFSEVVQLVIAARSNLTADQAASVANFFADDNSPHVTLLKELVYRRAQHAGLNLPADIGAVNWQEVIKILVELEPLIVPLIPLVLGDDFCLLPSAFCLASQQYRTECTPYGCRRVPVETNEISPKPQWRRCQNPRARRRRWPARG